MYAGRKALLALRRLTATMGLVRDRRRANPFAALVRLEVRLEAIA